jgi:tetratricopeptide (TPR) repeat protein
MPPTRSSESDSLLRALLAIALLAGTFVWEAPALAQVQEAAEQRIQLLNRKAMEAYDTLEFEEARAALAEAIQVARQAGIRRGEELTRTYLNLGILFGAAFNDRKRAIQYFVAALRLNRDAKLEPARATPSLEEMFAEARKQLPPRRVPRRRKLQHTPPDEVPEGQPVRIRVAIDPSLPVSQMVLKFRPYGSQSFKEIRMQQGRPGRYMGIIPARHTGGKSLHYYIEARGPEGERLQAHGSAASPNIIAIKQREPGRRRDEQERESEQEEEVSRKVFSVALMAGTGAGVVNGSQSEHAHQQIGTSGPEAVNIDPGLAVAPLHVAPELSYHLNDKWHLAVLGRIQVLNLISDDLSSNISILGELRAKRFFGEGPFRLYLAFGAGAGQIRHRVELGDYDRNAATPNDRVDTRIAEIGAFGFGGGLSWMFSSYVGFVAELNGLIMVPDFAAHLDLNTGLLLSF